MIGETIEMPSSKYTVIKRITDGQRPNAEVYLCEDANGRTYIAKQFSKPPSAVVGLSQYKHYGRRRDGSETVFNEIQDKNASFPFLVKHIDRYRYNGKWLIIMEYVSGITLRDFIYSFSQTEAEKAKQAVASLAITLATWHNNGFAHGDPHLDNAIVSLDESGSPKVVLIDYCQIHHADFFYCKLYDCFNTDPAKRIKEDLENYCGKLGPGFRSDLIEVQEDLEVEINLVEIFDLHYKNNIKADDFSIPLKGGNERPQID